MPFKAKKAPLPNDTMKWDQTIFVWLHAYRAHKWDFIFHCRYAVYLSSVGVHEECIRNGSEQYGWRDWWRREGAEINTKRWKVSTLQPHANVDSLDCIRFRIWISPNYRQRLNSGLKLLTSKVYAIACALRHLLPRINSAAFAPDALPAKHNIYPANLPFDEYYYQQTTFNDRNSGNFCPSHHLQSKALRKVGCGEKSASLCAYADAK